MKKIISYALCAVITISSNAQIIRVVAGNGTDGISADGILATSSSLSYPRGIVANAGGDLFIAEYRSNKVRKVRNGILTTTAGTGGFLPDGDGGPATAASIGSPYALAMDTIGNLYIMGGICTIRKIDKNGIITTVAGNGTCGYNADGGKANAGPLNNPAGMCVDASGNLLIAENTRIRKVDKNGIITTIAGNANSGFSGDGGLASSATLYYALSLAVDKLGNIFIGDYYRIRKIGPNGVISTIAGNGTLGYNGDGIAAKDAILSSTNSLTVDPLGQIYFIDTDDHINYRVRKIDTAGIISTFVGNGTNNPGNGGLASNALVRPSDIWIDKTGAVFTSEQLFNWVRKIAAPSKINSFSPTAATYNSAVVISGSNFFNVSSVKFGGVPALSFQLMSNTTINAVVGAGATGNVEVVCDGGTVNKDGFTYFSPPSVSNFAPVSAASDSTVTIIGTGFLGSTNVSFGGIASRSFTVINNGQINAIVGNGASGSVSVTTPNGTGSAAGFIYTGPTITSFSPSSAATGSLLTINGTNLTGTTEVRIGGRLVTTLTVVSASKITAVVGSGASGVVSVTTPLGVATKAGFIFLGAPDITSFSPSSAGTGTVVTITGSNFPGTTSVKFGGIEATSFTVASPTKITAVVNSAKTGSVEVTTPTGIAVLAGFGYELNLCVGGSTIINAPFTGISYQWQVNSGGGFTDLTNTVNYAGVTSSTLQLINIPGLWNGYEYRCIVGGTMSAAIRLHITNTWKGTINSSWENAGNWSCGILPDSTTDVIVPVKSAIVVNSDVLVKSLRIDSTAVVKISSAKKVRITGTSNSIKIVKTGLAETSYLLYGNTSGYVLLPGEKVTYVVKKLTEVAPRNELPLMVTTVPCGALIGVKEVITGE